MPHPEAGDTVSVQQGVEVRHHEALDVVVAAHLPLVKALHGGGHAAEDPHLVAREGELATLQISHLEAERLYQVEVEQVGGWCWQVV